MDITDKIALLVALHWVKNFNPCNKYLWLLDKYNSLVTKKFPIDEFLSQINSIWGNRNIEDYMQLVTEKLK